MPKRKPITTKINTKELDKVTKKVNQLIKLLKEARALIDSLGELKT